ncbi:MAG: gfo/Idh/MocA family oxidoreductase, partial [Clostridiales bacterium]|nr:gfo/Idh/MocA family oxidoreductase [Clostridiales bacterium]
ISPYGKCAYKCDNNVVDHQTVTVQFENGATGSHNMTGGCAYSQRIITIIGSLGEIRGVFEDQKFTVSYINPTADGDHTDEITDISDKCSAYVDHGGGDHALVEDFIKYVRGEKTSISCTSLDDSLDAYRVVFAADKSMSKNGFAVVT